MNCIAATLWLDIVEVVGAVAGVMMAEMVAVAEMGAVRILLGVILTLFLPADVSILPFLCIYMLQMSKAIQSHYYLAGFAYNLSIHSYICRICAAWR